MSSDHFACLSTGSTLSPISLTPRLSNSGFSLASAPSSVVQTGVKSFGCENSSAQLLPIQSWNLILPSVVSASKSGARVPSWRAMLRPHVIQVADEFVISIPRSRHNPKILGVDDAEIVGYRITEVRPIPRNFFTQETERRIGKLGASCVALVVRDMLVHHAP